MTIRAVSRRILPVDWVKDNTQPYSKSNLGPDYGYMWWTGFQGGHAGALGEALPHAIFFAMGYGRQFAFVLPDYDMVIVHRVDRPVDRLTHSAPRLSQIGRLLRLILEARPS
jgi:CubicO group peptidase (beta-lactamase class C family)